MANDQRPKTNDVLLCYITDRHAFAGDESARRRRLLEKISEAAHAGVDYIQLREKDLTSRELELLARDAASTIREAKKPATAHWPLATDSKPRAPALLINSRSDIALAAGADGVHLRSDDVSPTDVKRIWAASLGGADAHVRELLPAGPLTGVSCHSPAEVAKAAAQGATFAVFAPVFEKKDAPATKPAGLARLREACREKIPVLALGGITLENARSCLDAGAAGIAAIRLFRENDIAEVVRRIRGEV